MISLWNRKEVYNGYSIKAVNKVKEILISNGIKYTTRVVNRNNSNFFGPSRNRTSTFGEKAELANIYYLYVHKDDYDKAIMLIGKN